MVTSQPLHAAERPIKAYGALLEGRRGKGRVPCRGLFPLSLQREAKTVRNCPSGAAGGQPCADGRGGRRKGKRERTGSLGRIEVDVAAEPPVLAGHDEGVVDRAGPPELPVGVAVDARVLHTELRRGPVHLGPPGCGATGAVRADVEGAAGEAVGGVVADGVGLLALLAGVARPAADPRV